MIRSRRLAALILAVVGVLCLASATTAYVRAERFRRDAISAPLPPSYATPLTRPHAGDLIGLLEIPRLRMCDPIVEGDGDEVLSRAIGHLPDTPLPWEHGNVALAGHRDTVFRPLARIRSGDVIRIVTGSDRYEYAVRDIRVVAPDDLSVLEDGPGPSLTLITCYPFRFIGPAPERFVIRAERLAARAGHQRDGRDCGGNANPAS